MADRTAQIKVTIKSDAAKAGIKEVGDETKKQASGMKAALGSALGDGVKAGKDAFKGLLSDVKSVVGTIGGLMGGMGLAELVKGGIEANAKMGALSAGIRFAGGTARDAAGVMKQLRQAALDTAQDSMLMVDVFQGIRGETGELDFATAAIDDVAVAARGAHKPLDAMGNVAGTLREKFGIAAGDELQGALADVVGLSEKGGVSFEDMAEKLGLIGAYAKEAGLEGREGFGQMIGLLNLADNANGNFKKGLTGVGALLEQLGSGAGKNKIAAALGISGGALKGDALSQIEAIMKATKGQKGQLEKAFGGETLKLLVDMGKTYAAAFDATGGSVKEKSTAATEALRAAIGDASKSAVTWADIQNEAAAQMKESPQQLALATEKLRQAFQSEKFQTALGQVIDRLPQLAEWIAKITGWTVDNPGLAITAAIVASIGKAAIGETIGSLVSGLFKSFPAATIGVGLLAAAAAAAAAAIADFEEKATKEEQTLDATPQLIKKAQQEIATTGAVSPDTLDALAARRAEFEAVQKAGELDDGTGERMSYAAILAAKVTGGADTLAAGEGVQNEARKLGQEGIQTTIGDLDALIAQAIDAKRAKAAATAPAGPPLPPSSTPTSGAGGAAAGPGEPGWDPQIFAAAMAGKELRVRVTNPNDIGGTGGAPTGAGPVPPGNVPR